jgi:hypothetical protein
MTFRYTKNATSVMQQRLLADKGRRQLLTRTFRGHCDGVVVTYTAYGQVKKIELDKAGRSRFEDEAKGTATNLEGLAAAIKGAVADANLQLRAAKEEAHRQSFASSDDARVRNQWFSDEGATLAPLPFRALADTPALVNEAASRNVPAATVEQLAFTSPVAAEAASRLPETNGAAAAGGIIGSAKNIRGLAATGGAYAPALLFLCDRTGAASTSYAARAGLEAHARDERYYWDRVATIRRAQVNVIGSTTKRGYVRNTRVPTETAVTASGSFTERIQVKFVD